MRGSLVATVAVALLALAPAAQAVQRFAAPGGSGSECTQAKPCSLTEAAGGAKAADEVIVTPGTYTVGGPIFLPPFPNVQVHGEAGAPMPKIMDSAGGPVLYLTQTGDSLSYMEIENDANGGLGVYCQGSKIDRVRIKVVGAGVSGVVAYQDCVIRNSLIQVEGSLSTALRGASSGLSKGSAVARNLTAIAAGSGSVGANSEYNEGVPGEFTLELQNSILQGAEADLKPVAGAKGPGNIAVNHSNFDSSKPVGEAKVIDGGGNQTAAALFVNAEVGDYHEALGSPTIDAGLGGELGPLDLDGSTRVQGSAVDIGAFESVPSVAQIQSLAVKPKTFRAGNVAGAVTSRKKKPGGPVGATVSYSLSATGGIELTVERKSTGRKAGKKCVRQTAGNKGHRKCALYKPLKGSFSVSGAAGPNSFKFSGRLGGKALKPGSYRLVGSAGGVTKRAAFTIVR